MSNFTSMNLLMSIEMHYRVDYPAASGRTVCQGHADMCSKFGHADWTMDGLAVGLCPRCGSGTDTSAPLYRAMEVHIRPPLYHPTVRKNDDRLA